jgi:uncharacterized membrane protein
MSIDTFSGTKPNLINHSIIKELESKINVEFNDNNIVEGWKGFYENYIQPNLLAIIVISLFILYLIIKYVIKKDEDEKKEKNEIDEEIMKSKHQKPPKIDMIKLMARQRELQRKALESHISDHISDDYLINESDSKDDNKNNDIDDDVDVDDDHVKIGDNDPTAGLLNPMDVRNHDGAYDLDEAAKLIFNIKK